MSDTNENKKDMNEDKKDIEPSSSSTSTAGSSAESESCKMLPRFAGLPSHSRSEPALHIPERPDQNRHEWKLNVILALFKELDGKIASCTTGEMTASQRREVEQIMRERKKLNSSFVDLIEALPCAQLKSRYTQYVDKLDERFNAAINRTKTTLNPSMESLVDEVPSFTVDLLSTPPGNQVDLRPFNVFMQRIEVFEKLSAESLRNNKTICNEISDMQDGYMILLMEYDDYRYVDMTRNIRDRIRALLLRASE